MTDLPYIHAKSQFADFSQVNQQLVYKIQVIASTINGAVLKPVNLEPFPTICLPWRELSTQFLAIGSSCPNQVKRLAKGGYVYLKEYNKKRTFFPNRLTNPQVVHRSIKGRNE
jgi:hypothetical protein